jgi:hypothetical protein
VAKERPINAEVPATEAEKAAAKQEPAPSPKEAPAGPPTPEKRPRRPVPLALKLIGGAVVVAVVFIAAAIVGGGSGKHETIKGAAPPVSSGGSQAPPGGQSTEELGYPAFATKNTTRIGGADAAANAAGVALAVFPSTAAGNRPAAVTLVDEASWASAIAASVLMAAPVRAPILVSTSGGLPEVSSEALDALDPQGSGATHGAALFAIGGATAPDGPKTTRVKAGGPAAEAAAVARLRDRLFGSPPAHLLIAPEEEPGFAMPAAAWAARSGDPVLFSGREKLPKPTAAELRRHPKTPVYVLGPPSAISPGAFHRIAAIDSRVKRVPGKSPVESAIALARYRDGDFGWDVNDPGHGFVVARDDSALDAAAASPLSASGTWGPLLLTDDAGTLPAALRGYLLDVKPGYTEDPTRAFYNHVWVIGDQEAIDVNQQAEIDSLAELAKIGGEE